MTTLQPDQIDYLLALLASYLTDGEIATTGVASPLPAWAIYLAQQTHAPQLTYISCLGAVNPRLTNLPQTSDDPSTLADYESFCSLPKLFDLAMQGRIDRMFFSGAQIDQQANLNLTCIGDYHQPKVKLPGVAGASSILANVKKPVLLNLRHQPRSLVPKVDFITAQGLANQQSIDLVTNLAVLKFTNQAVYIKQIHPWSTLEEIQTQTGFALQAELENPKIDTILAKKVLNQIDPDHMRYELW